MKLTPEEIVKLGYLKCCVLQAKRIWHLRTESYEDMIEAIMLLFNTIRIIFFAYLLFPIFCPLMAYRGYSQAKRKVAFNRKGKDDA